MDDSLTRSHYAKLNTPEDATIRSAHPRLLSSAHSAESEDQIGQAYDVFRDPSKRQRYDEEIGLAQLRTEKVGFVSSKNRPTPTFDTRVNKMCETQESATSLKDEPNLSGASCSETRDNKMYETKGPTASHPLQSLYPLTFYSVLLLYPIHRLHPITPVYIQTAATSVHELMISNVI